MKFAQELRSKWAGTDPAELPHLAATWLLRGQAFDALENHARALRCFQAALRADPFCYEAFQVCHPTARRAARLQHRPAGFAAKSCRLRIACQWPSQGSYGRR